MILKHSVKDLFYHIPDEEIAKYEISTEEAQQLVASEVEGQMDIRDHGVRTAMSSCDQDNEVYIKWPQPT